MGDHMKTTIDLPDAHEARAIAALRALYTRNNVVPAAGAAWAAFVQEHVKDRLRDLTLAYESAEADKQKPVVTPITPS